MLKNKRGLSTVVVTLLLVLITIAAFAIIANVLVPFVRDSLPKSSECLPYRDYFKFQEIFDNGITQLHYNCYNDSGVYGISVSNQGSDKGNVTVPLGFAIVYAQGADRKSIEFKEGAISNQTQRMLNSSKQNIKIPEVGGVQTYVYNPGSLDYISSMEIHPILSSGRTCDATDSINLIKCNNINLG